MGMDTNGIQNTTNNPGSTRRYPGESEKALQDEQDYPPQLNFNLNSYQRDEMGLVADIEAAREIIRNLQQIIRFLEHSPFEHLPLNTQAEISLYLVGTHLLAHPGEQQYDDQYAAKVALLEALFNEELDMTIQREKKTLDTAEILQNVESFFLDFGQ